LKLRFLGTGTSFGIPVIGCGCRVCKSQDSRDQRSRHAALLESEDGRRLLVDTPPELRLQLLSADIDGIDAVWYTHCHADHVHGVDDLRAFSARSGEPIRVYAAPESADLLRQRFDYIFDDAYQPPIGTSKPELRLQCFEPMREVVVAGFPMLPLAVQHGDVLAYGFRTGSLGYITDAKTLDDAVIDALRGVDTLVLNALWFGKSHPTHLNIEEAISVAHGIGARRTFLTHLTHRVSHQELLDALPAGIQPAYDGLTITLD
jgi:phosphoribosyl 1,2-cyclic phosphate phosphodiesterase